MKKNITLLLASILVITLATLSFASAAVASTILTPAASSTVTGTKIINASYTGYGANPANRINVSYYVMSAGLTANSSWSLIGQNNSHNLTSDSNWTVIAWVTTTLEDGTDYILNVTVINETGGNLLATDTNTAITVDNTIPSTPTLSPSTGTTDTDGTINFTGTVSGANTTACTLYFDGTNPGNPSYTMTHAGSSCAYQLTGMPEQTYKWYIENSDGTNTTNSATAEVRVDTTNSKPGLYAENQNLVVDSKGFVVGTESDKIPNWVVPLIAVLAVIGIGYLIAKRK